MPSAAAIRRTALIALFAGGCGIAMSPIFVRLSEIGPTATAFYRVFLAIPVLWAWRGIELRRRDPDEPRPPTRLSDLAPLALVGFFFAGDLAFWHWSITLTSVANSTLFANAAPVVVTIAGWLLWRQRVSRMFIAGLALALTGAILLMGHSLLGGGPGGGFHLKGDGLAVAAACFYAGYLLSVSRLRATRSTALIMTGNAVVSAALLLPLALLAGESLVPRTPYGWGVLVGVALLPQVAGQSLIAYALAHLPASFGSVVLLFQPVMSAALAWALLAEPVGWLQAAGGVVVLGGIFLARQGSR